MRAAGAGVRAARVEPAAGPEQASSGTDDPGEQDSGPTVMPLRRRPRGSGDVVGEGLDAVAGSQTAGRARDRAGDQERRQVPEAVAAERTISVTGADDQGEDAAARSG